MFLDACVVFRPTPGCFKTPVTRQDKIDILLSPSERPSFILIVRVHLTVSMLNVVM